MSSDSGAVAYSGFSYNFPVSLMLLFYRVKLSLSGMDYGLSEHPLDQHFSTSIEIYAKVFKVNYPSSDNLISHKNVQIQISGFLISAKQLTFLSNFAM